MFSKRQLIGGFKVGSLYTNSLGYDRFYPRKGKGNHPDTLMQFINQLGIHQNLTADNTGGNQMLCTQNM
jgi:hypothetical protein